MAPGHPAMAPGTTDGPGIPGSGLRTLSHGPGTPAGGSETPSDGPGTPNNDMRIPGHGPGVPLIVLGHPAIAPGHSAMAWDTWQWPQDTLQCPQDTQQWLRAPSHGRGTASHGLGTAGNEPGMPSTRRARADPPQPPAHQAAGCLDECWVPPRHCAGGGAASEEVMGTDGRMWRGGEVITVNTIISTSSNQQPSQLKSN